MASSAADLRCSSLGLFRDMVALVFLVIDLLGKGFGEGEDRLDNSPGKGDTPR